MTLLTIRQAASRVKRSQNTVLRYCRRGYVRAQRGRHPDRHQTVWLVDYEDGDLTEVQHQCIDCERWHELLDIQPDDAAPGAVRVTWSDGETFAILPNGDTTDYRYLRPHILEELCQADH